MEIIPAIDIMNKKVVRLTQGDPATSKSYMESPLVAALHWQNQGAKRIHIIDLDAAMGKPGNKQTILTIADRLKIPIQTGGGIRTVSSARSLLDQGLDRVILGSMPLKKPEDATKLLQEYGPTRVIIALDHENLFLRIEGWKERSQKTLTQALRTFTQLGFKWFVVTDITRDGTLRGPDLNTMTEVAGQAYIIASGGISRLKDLTYLKKAGVKAVVVGKALYEKKFTFTQALKEVQSC